MSCESSDIGSCGNLGIIALESAKELGQKLDQHFKNKHGADPNIESYLIQTKETRFSNGEGKVVLTESVRGKDIYYVTLETTAVHITCLVFKIIKDLMNIFKISKE